MPLVKSCTREAISRNIKTSMHEGRPQKQAVAIALDVARKNSAKCGGKIGTRTRKDKAAKGAAGH